MKFVEQIEISVTTPFDKSWRNAISPWTKLVEQFFQMHLISWTTQWVWPLVCDACESLLVVILSQEYVSGRSAGQNM